MDKTEKLLKDLTDASGVPGYETEVRRVIRSYLKPHGEITQDKMSSLICKKDGKTPRPKVMLAGHIHSHSAIIKRNDFDNTVKLLSRLIEKLDKKTVDTLTEW